MNLLVPTALAFLAAIPVIVLLHTLRRKRDPVRVPSLLLWRQARWEGSGQRITPRIRDWLLLLLQIAIAAALALALTRPAWLRPASGTPLEVLVVDVSASMGALQDGRTRIEAAREAARDLAGDLDREARVALIAAGPPDRVLVPLTRERAEIGRVLGELTPVDREGDLVTALALARGMARGSTRSRIHLFTDRAFDIDPARGLERLDTDRTLVVHDLGGSAPNVGIVAFDARRDPSSPSDWHVLVEVLNDSPQEREVELALDLDGVLLDVRPWRIPAGERLGRVFEDLLIGPGVLTASVTQESGDALAVDDAARLVIEPRAHRRVALVGEAHPALERALDADPALRITRYPASVLEAGGVGLPLHDAVVLSRTLPARLPPMPVLLMEPPTIGTPTPVRGGRDRFTRDRLHPVTRLLDLDGVVIRELGWPRGTQGLESLVEIGTQPLVLAGTRPGGRMVAINLDLAQTDLTRRAAFPILLSSALEWLTSASSGGSRHATRAGEPLAIPVPGALTSIDVQGPDGRRHDVPVEGGIALFSETDRAGLYRVRMPGRATLAAVNLVSATESRLSPRWAGVARAAAAGAAITTAEEARSRPVPLWGALAWLALAVASVEWWFFRKREAW